MQVQLLSTGEPKQNNFHKKKKNTKFLQQGENQDDKSTFWV